jgi:uracil DNA glycosylase superfamily protein
MAHASCPGYPPPYDALVADYPAAETYPVNAFRVEWGPIFHRGRLDGHARVLVIGQDPATHEAFTRRILVGTAGQRTQGLLERVGITKSYVMVNTFLYSVYGQGGGNAHQHDAAIAAYRNQWLDALRANNHLDAIITLGTLAADAFTTWAATPGGQQFHGYHAAVMHPTYPESASASGSISYPAAVAELLANWNAALPGLGKAITHVDGPASLTPYGTSFVPSDYSPIPEADLPAGLPDWTRGSEPWATREGKTAADKRATLVVQIPADERPW